MINNAKKLFLIDGLGAIFSLIMLGGVLSIFNNLIGMPRYVLYFLACFPCVFAIYDFNCYFLVEKYSKHHFRNIALSNLIYCIISVGLLFYFRNNITALGWIYFILELSIISALIILELNVDKKLSIEA